MTKLEILSLIQDLAVQTLPADPVAAFFDESLDALGKRARPPLISAELFPVVAGTADYAFDADAIRLHAVFIGGKQLSSSRVGDLEAYDKAWRTLTGAPYFFTTEQVNNRTLTLVPNPTTASDPFIFTHGAPFGEDFPANAGVQIFSHRRDTDFPDWIALFLAIDVMAQEYARPSAHQDVAFSEICAKVADVLYRLGGLQ